MPHECETYLKTNKAESAEMTIFLNPGVLILHPEGIKDDKHAINDKV